MDESNLPVFSVENVKKYMPRRGDMPANSKAKAAPHVSNKKPSKG